MSDSTDPDVRGRTVVFTIGALLVEDETRRRRQVLGRVAVGVLAVGLTVGSWVTVGSWSINGWADTGTTAPPIWYAPPAVAEVVDQVEIRPAADVGTEAPVAASPGAATTDPVPVAVEVVPVGVDDPTPSTTASTAVANPPARVAGPDRADASGPSTAGAPAAESTAGLTSRGPSARSAETSAGSTATTRPDDSGKTGGDTGHDAVTTSSTSGHPAGDPTHGDADHGGSGRNDSGGNSSHQSGSGGSGSDDSGYDDSGNDKGSDQGAHD